MVDDAGCSFAVVVVVEIVVTAGTVVVVIGFVIWFSVGFLTGVFFFSLPFVPGSTPLLLCQVDPQFLVWDFRLMLLIY